MVRYLDLILLDPLSDGNILKTNGAVFLLASLIKNKGDRPRGHAHDPSKDVGPRFMGLRTHKGSMKLKHQKFYKPFHVAMVQIHSGRLTDTWLDERRGLYANPNTDILQSAAKYGAEWPKAE